MVKRIFLSLIGVAALAGAAILAASPAAAATEMVGQLPSIGAAEMVTAVAALGVAGVASAACEKPDFDHCFSREEVERIASICHEVNRAWCEFQGDTSQPSWADAPDWQKQSAINGVNFTLGNPDAGDSASHDSWSAEKVAAGWVYGEVKDPNATPPTHPCLVAFDDLPPEQQFKDRLFRTIVLAAAA